MRPFLTLRVREIGRSKRRGGSAQIQSVCPRRSRTPCLRVLQNRRGVGALTRPSVNRLEPIGTDWNRLEPIGTDWNRLEPIGTGTNYLGAALTQLTSLYSLNYYAARQAARQEFLVCRCRVRAELRLQSWVFTDRWIRLESTPAIPLALELRLRLENNRPPFLRQGLRLRLRQGLRQGLR